LDLLNRLKLQKI